jgi:tetratricopeptide (TPR) repeat protein
MPTPFRAAVPLLVLTFVAAVPPSVRAQEEAEPAPATAERAPHPAGVETTEDWIAFTRELAAELRARDRIPDLVEELMAYAVLDPDQVDVVADAALLLFQHATTLAHGTDPGSPYLVTVEQLIGTAVSRGGVGDPRLAYLIGRLRLLDGRYNIAYDMLREAQKAGYDAERVEPWIYVAAVNRAPRLLDLGRAPEVIEELERLLREQPDHPRSIEAKINLASAYRHNRDRVRSLQIVEELTAAHPGDHRAWQALGREHLDQSRLEDALEAYRKALALSGAHQEAYAKSLASIALVLYKLGRFEESEKAVKGYLELERESASGLRLLAQLSRERGDTLEALRLLRRADRIAPNDPSVLTLMEQIHFERGEVEEAEAVRKRHEAIYYEPGKEEAPSEPGNDEEAGDGGG